jgi:hypothetical protein
MEFNGSLDELKTLVSQLQIPCHWEHKGSYQLAVFEDGISNLKLNSWPETGAIRLVGDPEVRHDAERRLKDLLANP